jgi:alkylhydroperoxidase/carboxymuconolactone decarboxylase family protein YurZ
MADRKSGGEGTQQAYRQFVQRFPELEKAWDLCRQAEKGSLDEKTLRLVKLAVAVAREAEGATHSAARKALRAGVSRQEMEQVVALSASTIGFPAAVKALRWIVEISD